MAASSDKKQPVVVEFEKPVHKWLKQRALDGETTMAGMIRAAVFGTYGSEPGFPAQEAKQQQ